MKVCFRMKCQDMPDFDGKVFEPRSRQRKYRVYLGSQSLDLRRYKNKKHWMILLSVTPLEDVPGKDFFTMSKIEIIVEY